MSNQPVPPFELCGCIRTETEAEARAIQTFLREILGAGGFQVQSVEMLPDGAKVTRQVAP